jgi:hypothetical protein
MMQFRTAPGQAGQAPLAPGTRPGGPGWSQMSAIFEASKLFDSPQAGFRVGLAGRAGTGQKSVQDLRHENSAKYFWVDSGDPGRAASPPRTPDFEGRFEAEKLCNKCSPKIAAVLAALGIPIFSASAIQGFSEHPGRGAGSGLGCPDLGGFPTLSGASLPSPMGLRIRLRFQYNSIVRFQAAKIGQFGF